MKTKFGFTPLFSPFPPVQQHRYSKGMTLVELLVVVAVIGVLAAMMLPALTRVGRQSKVQRARLEEAQLVSGISEYQSLYGRFPVSDEAIKAAGALDEDVTFGGVIEETGTWVAGPSLYLTNNAEVMAVLLDLESYGDGAPTINRSHLKNPRGDKFLNPNMPGGTNAAPGVGVDGIYRDPWGSPYAVTLDLNGDGRARDFFYREPAVSEDPQAPGRGLNGLFRSVDGRGNVCFEATVPVMVWSAGPDRRLDTKEKANREPNRDNILSWQK
ncbi:MAG TPA: prepilin-type N-terminal cleavage/methylation domain-containing protein [Candidatus Binatia bacterium]|nr:prepilin-type N-terminal cleavage/methylation domain-containing protein [Candidatus Binatia bacterium]